MLDIQHEIATFRPSSKPLMLCMPPWHSQKISLHALRANIDQLSRPELLAELQNWAGSQHRAQHLATLSR